MIAWSLKEVRDGSSSLLYVHTFLDPIALLWWVFQVPRACVNVLVASLLPKRLAIYIHSFIRRRRSSNKMVRRRPVWSRVLCRARDFTQELDFLDSLSRHNNINKSPENENKVVFNHMRDRVLFASLFDIEVTSFFETTCIDPSISVRADTLVSLIASTWVFNAYYCFFRKRRGGAVFHDRLTLVMSDLRTLEIDQPDTLVRAWSNCFMDTFEHLRIRRS